MPLSDAQKAYADRAEANGYLPAYRSIIQEMCASFFWHGNDDSGDYHILKNGTVCFVDTGSALFAVTAAHVLSAYIKEKSKNPNIICQLGNMTFSPENHVISIDHKLDLATFSVSTVVVAGSGSTPYRAVEWPPKPIKSGEALLCGGHPGAVRREHAHTVDQPFQWFIAGAQHSEERIAITLELEDCHVPLTGQPLDNHSLGGMSGGPIFRYIPPAPIERIELAGFIYEFQESFGLLFSQHALHICKSGKILGTSV